MANPSPTDRLRQTGADRLERARGASSQEDWKHVAAGRPDFAFQWGTCWRQCVEYHVADYHAEIGFYSDVLGMSIMILNDEQAMFGTPDSTFCVMLRPLAEGAQAPGSDTFALEFMVEDIERVTTELEERGAAFEIRPDREHGGGACYLGWLHTPNGIRISLWCFDPVPAEEPTGT